MNLPTNPITFVQKQGVEYVQQTTTLPALLAQSEQGLIVYFYPKDNTQGCTTQATDFSANPPDGYTIIGVSKDSLASHKRFIERHNLTIALISDPDETLCRHFDVIRQKTLYGKNYLGLVRSTFVFAKDGKLIYEWRNHRAKEAVAQLCHALDTL